MQGQEIWTFQVSLFLREGDAGFPVQDLRAFHAGRRCRIYHDKQGLKFLCFAQHKRIQDIRCGVTSRIFGVTGSNPIIRRWYCSLVSSAASCRLLGQEKLPASRRL